MSLVAYGDSDDGSSDNEGEEENTNFPPKTLSFPVGESTSSSAELVQEAAPSTSKASEGVPLINSGKRCRLSSLLPKPNNPENATTVVRSNFSSLDPQNLEEDEDEILEVEEEYVPLSQIKKAKKTPVSETNEEQKSVGSLFSRMPSPWSFGAGISLGKKKESSEGGGDKCKKGKHPVRIVAPTISQEDLDDDDHDKEPAVKKPMKSKTGSGLSSLLPKPKHSITTTTFNPNKPAAKTTHRPLIPHTLTKKTEPAKQVPKKLKKSEDDGSGDEEDSAPVSFFSFSEKKSETETSTAKNFEKMKSEALLSVNILGDEKPMDVPILCNKSETITGRPEVDSTGYNTAENYGTSGVESGPASVSYGGERSSYGSTASVTHYYDAREGATTTYYQTTAESSQHYAAHEAYSENAGYYHSDGTHGMYNQTFGGYPQEQAQPDQTGDIDMEKLKRLQGKRNRNEQINIIDIKAADQTGDTQLQMTKITSEQIVHRPSKKKGSMPSSQQRRKHQITYLAFQAKEKEFELQQQWASNRQTKRQTQAKYGF